jgi:DNA-binding transcriptional ArsR family regulator
MNRSAEQSQLRLSVISRHLQVLEDARLISRRRKGRLHLIRTRAAGLAQERRWMARYAAQWDSAFDALDERSVERVRCNEI